MRDSCSDTLGQIPGVFGRGCQEVIYEYNSFLKPYISLFLEQQEKVVSLSTYAHMQGILQHFDHHVAQLGYDNCNFTEAQVFQWIKTVEGRDSTVHFYVSCLRSFLNFLRGYGFRPFCLVVPRLRMITLHTSLQTKKSRQ